VVTDVKPHVRTHWPNFILSLFRFAAVGSIDTSGISMLDELKKNVDRRGLQVKAFGISRLN